MIQTAATPRTTSLISLHEKAVAQLEGIDRCQREISYFDLSEKDTITNENKLWYRARKISRQRILPRLIQSYQNTLERINKIVLK